ncbi:MAG: excinuclease ABC subunit UvrC [Bacteroidales bacterium]|nr:excinuclease ABC subunit UvrC [Bacteroidales bacterium]
MKANNKNYEKLSSIIKTLPEKPGVYQFFDKNDEIIYIGKAKKLKKRVASYFKNPESLSGKIAVLVKKIFDIKFIVVNSEIDALLLENNLIKKYKPRYNILLKDDKTYPWICIKNEPFPRVFATRNIIKDGSLYFGPYASVKTMNTLLELIRQLYPIRDCKHNLSDKNIKGKKYKLCLNYHIGKCKGPCAGLETREEYDKDINEVKEILKGNFKTIKQELNRKMHEYVEKLEFEKAQIVKQKIESLIKYQSKSVIVNPMINNVDVFSIITEEKFAYVNFIKVVNGSIIQAQTIEIQKKLNESPEDILLMSIIDFRQKYNSNSKEIIIPFKLDVNIPDTKYTIPIKGDKKTLLDLSERNTRYYKLEVQKRRSLTDPELNIKNILTKMKKDLRMKELPYHIEGFDNSNIQGTNAVSSMVVFKNAKPSKKDYRHYNIKTVTGPDDYASMEEVIYRRYKRLTEEKKPLPQLIVIDGGKGQLHSALKSLEKLGLRGEISIIGIAKRLEEIYFPNDSIPLYLDKRTITLKIIQQIRDEAHRFGITHHRKKRQKSTIKTELTSIKGIGETTSITLLKKYKSVEQIKILSLEELEKCIGKSRAKIIYKYFQKKA